MPETRRTCQWPGCASGEAGATYTTLEGLSTQDSVLKELHFTMVHGVGGGGQRQVVSEVKPDKFPRPEIADPATDTD